MPEEVLATFSVRRLEILDVEGNVDAALMPELADARAVESALRTERDFERMARWAERYCLALSMASAA